ncbi:MAG TPA: trehalase family glycosidase [Candidatus Saccharimonadia bacterium]
MTKPTTLEGPTFTPDQLRPALEYIDTYWKKLERFRPHDDGTLIGLPEPYFVPSSRNSSGFAFEEIYYWDTYFIAQGLIGTPRQHLVKGLAEDLIMLMRRFEIVPNAGRMYHVSRSQPPFLSTLVLDVYRLERNRRWLADAMSTVKREYRTVWMGVAHPNWRQVFNGLSRYYDVNMLDDLAEAESGWDMTTRFNREALSYIPVDLNALLYKYERDFAESAKILGDHEEAREWQKRAVARQAAMHQYLWDNERGMYFDYNYMTGRLGAIYSLAAFLPMWAGMDDARRVHHVMNQLQRFEYDGGLATTAREPAVSMPLPTQWAYPNGWAPLIMLACQGMERYGYHGDAERIARKWIATNLRWFEEHGEFLEKYNVVEPGQPPLEGVYPSQSGFGWTNAVFTNFCRKYLREDELPELSSASDEPSPLSQLVRNPRRTLRRVGIKLNNATTRRLS